MRIELTVTEAMALATVGGPVPALVRSVHAEGSVVHLRVDPLAVPDVSGLTRLALTAVGEVSVAARFHGYADGVATFAVEVQARGLPVHSLLRHLTGTISATLREHGLPEGLVELRPGDGAPLALVHVQQAVEAKASGVRVTGLDLRDAVVRAEVGLGDVRLRVCQVTP